MTEVEFLRDIVAGFVHALEDEVLSYRDSVNEGSSDWLRGAKAAKEEYLFALYRGLPWYEQRVCREQGRRAPILSFPQSGVTNRNLSSDLTGR